MPRCDNSTSQSDSTFIFDPCLLKGREEVRENSKLDPSPPLKWGSPDADPQAGIEDAGIVAGDVDEVGDHWPVRQFPDSESSLLPEEVKL